MENQTAKNPNERNKNSKALLYTIIGVLVALNAGLLYMWQKSENKEEKTAKELTTANTQNKELKDALDEAEFLLKKIREDSAVLASKNETLNADIVAKKNELAAKVAELRSTKSVDSKQIAALQSQIQGLKDQIAKLETENAELKETNAKLDEERARLQTENQDVIGKNDKLTAENTKMRQRLSAEAIKVETLKKKLLSAKETTTTRAKDVETIRTSFTLAESATADGGEKIVYIKITGPGGTTLANGSEGGTFDFENQSSKYTYKTTVQYDPAGTKAPTTVWRPATELKPGAYTVEIYCDGFRIGSQNVTLR